jgi:hypothetical protein
MKGTICSGFYFTHGCHDRDEIESEMISVPGMGLESKKTRYILDVYTLSIKR